MHHDEIAMDPTVVEFGKIAVMVPLPALVAPEETRHVRERARGDQLAGYAVLHRLTLDASAPFEGVVEDRDRRPQGGTLAPAHVEREEGISCREGARDVGPAGDVI